MNKSRFADVEGIDSEYKAICLELIRLNARYQLPDFTEINKDRCSWNPSWNASPQLYAPRLWEYPYAFLGAELTKGMRCVDVGAGSSPFTALLSATVGRDCVTAVEPKENNTDTAFGFNKDFFVEIGVNLVNSPMSSIPLDSNVVDRVFCISVLEHIQDPVEWQMGITEMVRILKPGGRLILTFDLGIERPFIHPLEVLQVSGLSLLGSLDLSWPKRRLVNYEGVGIDVFGLSMVKSDRQLFVDPAGTRTIAEHEAFRRFETIPISDGHKTLLRDVQSPLGRFKSVAKLLLNRY